MKRLPLFCVLLAISLGLTTFPPLVGAIAPPLKLTGMAAGAPAQAPLPAPSTPAPTGTQITGASLLASQVLRYPILDINGNEIGQLVNLLIDTDKGCVRYAVVAYSGGAGLTGERALPIPIELLSVDYAQGGLDLNVDLDTLAGAPSFPRYNWPDVSSPGWDRPVRSYWENFGAAGAAASTCAGVQTTGTAAGASTPTRTLTPALPVSPSPAPAVATSELLTRGTPQTGKAAGGMINAGRSVAVTLREYAIDMPASLPAGSIRMVVTNAGTMPHNFAIAGQGLEQAFTRDLQPGQSRRMDITLEPGTYDIYCPIDNHAALGMRLILTVTPSGTLAPESNPGTAAPGTGIATPLPANGTPTPASTLSPSTGGPSTVITATPSPGSSASSSEESASGTLVRLSRFPSYTIVSTYGGQQLGRVTDFVLDPVTWRLLYSVASPLGGLLPSGTPVPLAGTVTPEVDSTGSPSGATPTILPPVAAQRLTLIPWNALTVDNAQMAFSLKAPANALERAPAFTARNWPNMSRSGWDSSSRSYWENLGIGPGPTPATGGGQVPTASSTVTASAPTPAASPGTTLPQGSSPPGAR